MTRLTEQDARDLCAQFGIWRHPLPDWHAMDSDQKERVLGAADFWRYRAPKNANGSRGRYFAAYLSRVLERAGQ